MDPLDGTLPYTFGISDHFSVSIALVKNTTPILGVIYAPKRKELYIAVQGHGAFCNGSRLRASTLNNLHQVMMGIDYGKLQRADILGYQKKLLAKEGVTATVSYGCATLPLSFVASGKLHGYCALKLEPWDMAAAVIINREAGAKVTNLNGTQWKLGDESILVANPKLHATLLSLFMKPRHRFS